MRRSHCIAPRSLAFTQLISVLACLPESTRSGSVQALYLIHNIPFDISHHRLVNGGDIGDH
jgi:hypothetical protein